MRKEESIELIKNGRSAEWNEYRKQHPEWIPDLSNTDLSGYSLVPNIIAFDLSKANLCGTKFSMFLNNFTKKITLPNGWSDSIKVNLKDAIINSKTTFPNDFNSVDYKAVLISDADPRGNPEPVKVFISYAWANGDVIAAIDQWLRMKNINTRLDKRDFFAGARIMDEIIRVMQNCDVILVFFSRQSKDKPWPQFEAELAKDLEMNAIIEKRIPPRIIYVILDDTPLPGIQEKAKLAVVVKGKRFELVCEEIYHHILQLPPSSDQVDLSKWSNYTF